MGIYIIGFGISVALLYLSCHVKRKQRGILAIVALLIPCIIASLRANNIGTDTSVYLVQITNSALHANNFKEYLDSSWFYVYQYKYVSDYEIAFIGVVYACAKIFGSLSIVKFVVEALMIYPTYFALNKMGKDKYIWFSFLVYYCMIFNSSLNVMRQFIAMAFVLLAFAHAINKEYRRAILIEFIAISFHTSAVLGIAIFALYLFVNNDVPIRGFGFFKSYSRMAVVIFAGLLLIVATNIVVKIMSSVGLSGYINYISGDVQFLPNQIIARLPIIVLFLVLWKKMQKREPWNRFLFVMLVYDLICSQFASVFSYSGRITWYFIQFEMISLPSFYVNTKKSKLIFAIIVAYLFFYWWFYYVNLNWGETVPFEFY